MRKAAALDFVGLLLQSGTPLQTPNQAAFASQLAQLPPAQRAALEFPGSADAVAIIHEVFGSSSAATLCRDASLEALYDFRKPAMRVQTFANVLTIAECAILCRHCDSAMAESQHGGSRDNVDGLPDFQVNVDRRGIEELFHESDGAAFIDRFDGLLHGADGIGQQCQTQKAWARIGMFVRRYSANTRPWMPFHCDGNAYTANVALSGSSNHEGGKLLCLVGGVVQACIRELGAATVHGGDVCHAVTPVTAGTRYALLIFFHEAATSGDAGAATVMLAQGKSGASLQKRHAWIQEL